jgi:hypothetical protein
MLDNVSLQQFPPMTDPYAALPAPAPAPKVSFFEDVIDIFFQPAAVFRRQQNSSAWLPMLFVAIVIAVIFFASYNSLEPVFSAEFNRAMAKQAAKGQTIPPEALAKSREIGEKVTRYGIGVVMLFTMFVLGCVSWLVGKLVGSKQAFGAALMVAGWSYMPRIIGAVAGAIQGLLMDPANLTGQMSISLSPARFMDPETTNPLLFQVAGRFDLIPIWVTILLAVGLYVTGKVTKQRAVIFGILIWIVGTLPALRQGLS